MKIPAAPRHPATEAASDVDVVDLHHWLARAADVCEAAANGNLEERVLSYPREGDLGRMMASLNHLLDMTDAFVREAGASLDHAAHGKFFRRVIQRGMRGSFKHGAGLINAATEKMAETARALDDAEIHRLRLADEFEEGRASVRGLEIEAQAPAIAHQLDEYRVAVPEIAAALAAEPAGDG